MFSCQIRIRSFHRLQFQFWLKMAIKIGLENRDSRNFLVRRHPKFALACLNWMHAISLLRSKFHFVARKVFISLIAFWINVCVGIGRWIIFRWDAIMHTQFRYPVGHFVPSKWMSNRCTSYFSGKAVSPENRYSLIWPHKLKCSKNDWQSPLFDQFK